MVKEDLPFVGYHNLSSRTSKYFKRGKCSQISKILSFAILADCPFPGAQINRLVLGIKTHSKYIAKSDKKVLLKARQAVQQNVLNRRAARKNIR